MEILRVEAYLKSITGISPRVGDRDWKDVWLDSPEYQQVISQISAIKEAGLARPHDSKKKSSACTCK